MIKTTKPFLYIPVITTLYITNIFGSSPINIPSGVDVEISGEVEVEFVDVEGRGGASYEDDFVKKIETRSPYTQIDKAVLDSNCCILKIFPIASAFDSMMMVRMQISTI